MEISKMLINKMVTFSTPLMLLSLLAGCAEPHKSPAAISKQNSLNNEQQSPVVKRFQESASQGRTVVESAIELSEKYAQLSEQTAQIREKNKDLINENTQLKNQVDALESELKKTQKELQEANQLLIDMLNEMNNWKTDILGFRSEMREAAKAQLEALLKVLEILGGEVETKSTQMVDTPSQTPSSNTKQSEKQTTGDINE
jgi:chromosome segregation ATPase